MTNKLIKLDGDLKLLQMIILIQFMISLSIFVLTTIGISLGYSVVSFYLLSLIQLIMTLPGAIFLVFPDTVWLSIYGTFQFVTAASELYWVIYMVSDNRQSTCIIAILILFIIQLAAIFCVLFWKDKVVRFAVKPSIKPIEKRNDTQAKKRMDMSRSSRITEETGKTTKSTKSTTQRSDDSERSVPNPSRSAESVGEPTKDSTKSNKGSRTSGSGKHTRKQLKTLKKSSITTPIDSLMDVSNDPGSSEHV